MKPAKPTVCVLLLAAMVLTIGACSRANGEKGASKPPAPVKTAAAPVASVPLYTAYNLWYEDPLRISCVNYQRGQILPAGTRVTAVKSSRSKISFTTEGGLSGAIEFRAEFHPGVSLEAFQNRLFTAKDFGPLTRNMSAAEIECIKTGSIKPGVGKNCVLVTYGYPPEHRTPSTKGDAWIYWTNRFATKALRFGPDGLTTGGNP